jgi:DNA-binding MarR family transcriptional regulator
MAEPVRSDCICTSLRMAARVVTREYDRALQPAGVSTNAYAILARIEKDGPMAIGALATRLALDRTTLSREIDALVLARLVSVTRDPADRRRRVVSLTAEGARRVELARPLWAKAQRELAGRFDGDRAVALVGELHALVETVA